MRITIDKDTYCCTTSIVDKQLIVELYQDDLRCFSGVGQSHYHALQNALINARALHDAAARLLKDAPQ